MIRLLFIAGYAIAVVSASCATKEFMSCVVQLNSHKVQFDTNIMHVVYNISTEAKLLHTCRSYERVLPCFDQRLNACGSKSQKAMLEKGKRLHSYLCAPFSMQRQKIFLRQGKCIQKVLKEPIDSKCEKPPGLMQHKLDSCRSQCGDDLQCNTKADISELAACTYLRLEQQCGPEAAQFYSQMQQVLTTREYPVQCFYSLRGSTSAPPQTTTTLKTDTKSVIKLQKPERPKYMTTSYVTVYPESSENNATSTVRRADPKVRSRNFAQMFAPARMEPRAIIQESATTPRPDTVRPPSATTATRPPKTTAQTRPTHPIPATPVPLPAPKVTVPIKFQTNPYAKYITTTTQIPSTTRVFNKMQASTEPKWVPWYYNSKEQGSVPTNPMMAPFLDDVVTHPTLLPSVPLPPPIQSNIMASGPPQQFKFIFNNEPTPEPFKININWMDDPNTQSPWYQQTVPQQRDTVGTVPGGQGGAFAVVEPILNQLKTQPLNFTEMGNQASNYFNAALSAFSSAANENARSDATTHNDPWRSIIDAVAPTIQRVSPDIIPRIREEIARLDPN